MKYLVAESKEAFDDPEFQDDLIEVEASSVEFAAIKEAEENGADADFFTSWVKDPDGWVHKVDLEFIPGHYEAR